MPPADGPPPGPEARYRALLDLAGATAAGPDLPHALAALARALRAVAGADRVAFTPVPSGPRWVIDLRPDPPALAPTGADHLPHLLAWLGQQPEPWLWRPPVPPPLQNLTPADVAALLLLPVKAGPETVGLLELAGAAALDAEAARELGPVLSLALGAALARERAAELQRRLDREVPYLRDELKADRDLRTLTGDSAPMRAVRLAIQQVARTDSTVLVLGETGTGKELVARAIHQLSPRRPRLLVAVNCAALAPGVVASELFGHEAGAFTGASRRRIGRFELAHQGTLFLDEVAEVGPDVQALLLRALQERTIERVGAGEPIPVDVRLIAATHRDLPAEVAAGRFRADLFYRLNVFPIHVPPLRDRRDDIPDLTRHFLHHFNRRLGRQVSAVAPESLALLVRYDWPGNVRELENLVERAMIVCEADILRIDPSWLTPLPGPAAPAPPARSLREQERQTILDALARSRGRVYGPGGAAALLGLKPTTLYGKMRKHGIRKPPDDAQ